LLVTNFSSFHEVNEDPAEWDIMSFETKPKSGVTEYLPSNVRSLIESGAVSTNNEELLKNFVDNQMTKFHVMQVSRKYKGTLEELSKYCP
jgi:hypothetical protein